MGEFDELKKKRADRFNLSHDLAGCDVQVVMNSGRDRVEIRAALQDYWEAAGQKTGKYAHLSISLEDATRLLGLLKLVQTELGLPDAEPPQLIVSPPAKDRN